MYIKLFGLGIILFGVYLIYIKRHLEDDSLLVGSVSILSGGLVIVVGWLTGKKWK